MPIQFLDKNLSTTFETNSGANNTTLPGITKNRTISETEFVSDTFQTNDKDLEEVKAGMKKLGIDTLAQQASKDGKNSFIFNFIIFLKHTRQTQLSLLLTNKITCLYENCKFFLFLSSPLTMISRIGIIRHLQQF